MNDRKWIWTGLALFVAIVLFPAWHALASDAERARPELEYPETAEACVEATEYMVGNHMDLLNQWRNAVVREATHQYTSTTSGERFEMSLTETCLRQCHTNRETFCNRCHDYANVSPKCWDCHVEPEPN